MDLLVPALVSSTVGYGTGLLLVGRQRLLTLPVIHSLRWQEWVFVGLIAVLASLAARCFAGVFNGFHHLVRTRLREDGRFPKWLQTGLGGLFAGLVMLAFPQVYGIGLEAIRGIASGHEFADHAVAVTAFLLAALGLAKILASTFTVSTGGVGGLLFPSLFAGAAVGGSLGTLAAHQWPGLFPNHAAYVLIAMSATYAAAGKVPIASLLLLCEACANFSLALPMAIANLLAYALSGRSTVYDVQRERSSMSHKGYRWAVAFAVVVVLLGRFVVAV